MFIVSQNRREIVNVDTVRRFYVYRNTIVAQYRPGEEADLGKYDTYTRANEVFAQMLREVFPPPVHNTRRERDGVIIEDGWYEIPVETGKCWYIPEE